MRFVEKFARHGDVRIRYLDAGVPGAVGHPTIFVPGVVDTADEYTEALVGFSHRRILVVEPRGRGGSDAPRRGYSVKDQAGDVQAVIESEGIEQFHLMAFSRGTTTALVVAFGAPHRVLSVAIGDYLPVEVALPPGFAEGLWTSSWRGRANADRVQRHVLEGLEADSRPRTFWDELAALGVPVLLAMGGAGGFVDRSTAARYQSTVPGAEVVTIPGSDHDLFRPSRTAYPDAVLEFVARRLPGT